MEINCYRLENISKNKLILRFTERKSPNVSNSLFTLFEKIINDSLLYCICKKKYNSSLAMIGCDECYDWFHYKCVYVTYGEAKKHSNYICPNCSKKPHLKKICAERKKKQMEFNSSINLNEILSDDDTKLSDDNEDDFYDRIFSLNFLETDHKTNKNKFQILTRDYVQSDNPDMKNLNEHENSCLSRINLFFSLIEKNYFKKKISYFDSSYYVLELYLSLKKAKKFLLKSLLIFNLSYLASMTLETKILLNKNCDYNYYLNIIQNEKIKKKPKNKSEYSLKCPNCIGKFPLMRYNEHLNNCSISLKKQRKSKIKFKVCGIPLYLLRSKKKTFSDKSKEDSWDIVKIKNEFDEIFLLFKRLKFEMEIKSTLMERVFRKCGKKTVFELQNKIKNSNKLTHDRNLNKFFCDEIDCFKHKNWRNLFLFSFDQRYKKLIKERENNFKEISHDLNYLKKEKINNINKIRTLFNKTDYKSSYSKDLKVNKYILTQNIFSKIEKLKKFNEFRQDVMKPTPNKINKIKKIIKNKNNNKINNIINNNKNKPLKKENNIINKIKNLSNIKKLNIIINNNRKNNQSYFFQKPSNVNLFKNSQLKINPKRIKPVKNVYKQLLKNPYVQTKTKLNSFPLGSNRNIKIKSIKQQQNKNIPTFINKKKSKKILFGYKTTNYNIAKNLSNFEKCNRLPLLHNVARNHYQNYSNLKAYSEKNKKTKKTNNSNNLVNLKKK